MKRNDYITVNEAAKIKGCSRQAIHGAIKGKRLEAKTEESVIWLVSKKSLAKLVINANMKRNGRPRRTLCPGCDGELTSADREGKQCSQCQTKL